MQIFLKKNTELFKAAGGETIHANNSAPTNMEQDLLVQRLPVTKLYCSNSSCMQRCASNLKKKNKMTHGEGEY